MAKGKKHKEGSFENTRRNKIRKIERELEKNPQNSSAKKSLEHWKTVGRRDKHSKRKGSAK